MTQELTLPILLFVGLATRIATLPLFGMLFVIQTFVYPDAWGDHLLWGSMLLFLLVRDYRTVPLIDDGAVRMGPRTVLAALALTTNWSVYIWCVTHGRVVDAALGYLLSPIGMVLTGALVLHEHLGTLPRLALALAALDLPGNPFRRPLRELRREIGRAHV